MERRDTAPARSGWAPAISLDVAGDRSLTPRAVGSLRRAARTARAVRVVDDRVRASLSALSFWFAIVLPACYLSLLAAGIDDPDGLLLFLGLLGLHVIALVGGRGHAPMGRG